MKSLALLVACGCVLLVDAPDSSGEEPGLDCADPQTQLALTMCAGQEFEKADKALNAQYKITREAMRRRDAAADEQFKGAEEALVKAQRAWIAYRDAHCVVEGFEARGGTMEPMVFVQCQAEVTGRRTDELKALAENMQEWLP